MELPDESLRERPLFILGHHRSGTSLLTHLLDGHPSLIVAPYETYFFPHFAPRFEKERKKGRVQALLQEDLMRVWDPNHPYYRKYLSQVPIDRVWDGFWDLLDKELIPSYLSSAILAYGEASGQLSKRSFYWVEKTPNNEHFAKNIFRYWPNARCIHILRDPRDLHTTLKKRASFDLAPRTVVHNWRRSFRRAKENLQRYGQGSYKVLFYEDLVRDPKGTFQELHAFLNIEGDPIEGTPTLCGGKVDWHGNPVEGGFEGISTQGIGKWKSAAEGDLKEFQLIEAMLEKEMKELDYLSPENNPKSALYWRCLKEEGIIRSKELREGLRSLFKGSGKKRPVY